MGMAKKNILNHCWVFSGLLTFQFARWYTFISKNVICGGDSESK